MKNDYNNLKIPVRAPLHPEDTENQTYGCRQNNPDICKNNGLNNICAFVRDDCICHSPSKAWKKIYNELVKSRE